MNFLFLGPNTNQNNLTSPSGGMDGGREKGALNSEGRSGNFPTASARELVVEDVVNSGQKMAVKALFLVK